MLNNPDQYLTLFMFKRMRKENMEEKEEEFDLHPKIFKTFFLLKPVGYKHKLLSLHLPLFAELKIFKTFS